MDLSTPKTTSRTLWADLSALRTFLCKRRDELVSHNPALHNWFVDLALPVTEGGTKSEGWLPFLSIRAFKHEQVATIDPHDSGTRIFCSSGSTGSRRGQHILSAAGLHAYGQSTTAHFRSTLEAYGLPKQTPVFSLIPKEEEWSDSSLAAMIAMWKANGHPVFYTSPPDLPQALAGAYDAGLTILVIFGTTAHHLQVSEVVTQGCGLRKPQRPARMYERDSHADLRILVCDTGGTKGRTDAPSATEHHTLLERIYHELCGHRAQIETASEYGMSELCSQAWTVPGLSLRDFCCAPTLRVATVSPEMDRLCPLGELGFLAFIDERNTDSYPAIITEDYGWVRSDSSSSQSSATSWLTRAFTLKGRAPLASTKGCSLRVFGQVPMPMKMDGAARKKAPVHGNGGLVQGMHQEPPLSLFTPSEQKELCAAWKSALDAFHAGTEGEIRGTAVLDGLRNGLKSVGGTCTTNRYLEIVASANVCVTFLYPLYAAALTGYSHVRIFLPSNRDDDPLAAQIRNQIDWLVHAIGDTLPLSIELFPSSAGLYAQRRVDTAIVFGTDETIALFREHYRASHCRFLGFGQFQNCSILPQLTSQDASHAAEDCMIWKGRGCLTPAVVYFPPGHAEETDRTVSAFCEAFAHAFSREHIEHLEASRWFHRHDAVAIQAKLAHHFRRMHPDLPTLDVTKRVQKSVNVGTGWTVINLLRLAEPDTLARLLDLSCAGQGLVFLAPLSFLGANGFPKDAAACRPRFLDAHFGATWIDWLLPK